MANHDGRQGKGRRRGHGGGYGRDRGPADRAGAVKAAIHVRISQDRTGEGLGVERQEQDCRTLARQLGWDVMAVHVDNDVSAYKKRKRPGYRALLADIEAAASMAS